MLELKLNTTLGRRSILGNAHMSRLNKVETLYSQLKAFGKMPYITSQSRHDFNEIVEMISAVTREDMSQFRVNAYGPAMDLTPLSGIPEKAAQLMSFLEERHLFTTRGALLKWLLTGEVTLAVVFTDIVKSTELSEQLGPNAWNEVRENHFMRGKDLAKESDGFFVKTIGDSLMVVFRNSADALNFMIELRSDTRHPTIEVRQGAHIGPVTIKEDDVFGSNVNLAERVKKQAKGGDIIVTDEFRKDVLRVKSLARNRFRWQKLSNVSLKGFRREFVLWKV